MLIVGNIMRYSGLLLFVVITGCSAAQIDHDIRSRYIHPQLETFFGSEMLEIFSNPDRIESYRVRPEHAPSLKGGASISGYPIIRKGPTLTAAQSRYLLEWILNVNSYSNQSERTLPHRIYFQKDGRVMKVGGSMSRECIFQPGVAFKFYKDDLQVNCLVCFRCKEWAFIFSDRRGASDYFDRIYVEPAVLCRHVISG